MIETIRDLPSLTERDRQAGDMLDLFDFRATRHPDAAEPRDCAAVT
jgi:hypothetical protein